MKSFKEFLNEATATAKAYVKGGKISQDDYNTIYNLDKTSSKKYVDWVAIQIIKNGLDLNSNKSKLESSLSTYDDLVARNLIKSSLNDLKTFKDLVDIVEANKNAVSKREVNNQDLFKDELKGFTKDEDYSIVHNDTRSIVYAIYNHKLSCVIGKDSGWCTTIPNNKDHFKNYEKYGAEFLYLIDKQVKSSGHGHQKGTVQDVDYSKEHSNDMFAIHRYPDGKIIVTDKADKDNRVSWDGIKSKYSINDKIWGGYDNKSKPKAIMEVKTVADVINNLKFMGLIEDESEVEVK